MKLLEVSPWDIHFGDKLLETHWEIDLDKIPRELINSIKVKGLVDPIVVYTIENKYWCWRGTKRLRVARDVGLKKVKILVLDELSDDKPSEEEIQKLYKKPIRLFHHPSLCKWDVDSPADPMVYHPTIEAFVSSYHREGKLKKFFASFLTNHKYKLKISVVYDNQPDDNNRVYINEAYADFAKTLDSDLLFNFADDLTLHSNTVETAIECYLNTFPKLDGVVELSQENVPGGGRGVFLIGKKYYQHFPGNNSNCPDYNHFYVDEEIQLYSQSIGKYKRCHAAKVIHYNPKYSDERPDYTYTSLRETIKAKDIETWKQRQARGLLWGRDFERIG